MAKVVELKNYKLAKKYLEDYKTLTKAYDLMLRALEKYKYYRPVAQTITEIRNQKAILDAHKNTATKILNKEI